MGQSQLEKWGITHYEAIEIARSNLEQVPFPVVTGGSSCHVVRTGDSYDASRLLLPSFIEHFQVDGDPIAMAPVRDMLIVTGSNDNAGLMMMCILAKSADLNVRPLSLIPVRFDGDAWIDWMPEPDHPLCANFRELALPMTGQFYAQQRDLLTKLFAKRGTGRVVAEFEGRKREDGTIVSLATWTKDVDLLLPKADLIVFADPSKPSSKVHSPWKKVEQVVGHRMTATDYYPELMQVTSFPSATELHELGGGNDE